MFVARVKFAVDNLDSYEIGKIVTLYTEDNGVTCRYRYNKGSFFEFVIGNYGTKELAFEKGKILYSAILYLLNSERLPYNLDVIDFNNDVDWGHLKRTLDKEEPEQYLSNHYFFNNDFGFEVYEVENDFFIEYDNDERFNRNIMFDLSMITNHNYNFERIKDIKIDYSDNTYRIYRLLELINAEPDRTIQVLLLSVAFETLSNIELRDVINTYNQIDDLSSLDKHYLDEFLESEKELSVTKKCQLCIEKYSAEYSKDRKIFKNFYNLRSRITHGEKISRDMFQSGNYNNAFKLFLKLFRAKFTIKQ